MAKKFKNIKTGVIVETKYDLIGGNWRPLEGEGAVAPVQSDEAGTSEEETASEQQDEAEAPKTAETDPAQPDAAEKPKKDKSGKKGTKVEPRKAE